MKREIKRDMIVYGLLIIAAIVVYFWIIPTQVYLSGSAKAEEFSPDTFPRFVTIVLFLAAAGGLVNSGFLFRRAKRQEATAEAAPAHTQAQPAQRGTAKDKIAAFIPYIIFLFVLLYGILFAKIGFIAATAIVPPIILFVIGCRKWHYYLIYFAFATVLYLLFEYVLLVPIH